MNSQLTGKELWASLDRQQKGDLIRPMIEEQQLSYAQIGKILGVSRVAIAGAADRNKITSPYSRGARPDTPGSKGGTANNARKAGREAATKRQKPTISRARPIAALPPDDLPKAPYNPEAWLALPGTTPQPLHALEHDQCRWPIGNDLPFSFCGAPAADGKPYCATHNATAYRPAPPVKFRGRKTA